MINNWKKRILTPIGKICVLKTLVVPQLNHLFMSIPNPSDLFLKEINNLFYNFIWGGKTDKIKREILVKNYIEGGLKMIDIKKFMLALKSTWLRRLYKENKRWNLIIESQVDTHKLAVCGVNYISVCYQNVTNPFWKDVLMAVKNILDKYPDYYSNYLKIPLWYYPNVTVGRKPVYYENWFKNGIFYINDLVNQDLEFMSYDQFLQQTHVNTTFLHFHGLISSLKALKQKLKETCNFTEFEQAFIPMNLKIFLEKPKGTEKMYSLLIENNTVPRSQQKWQNSFDFEITDNSWDKIYINPFRLTSDTKLQWFQFRICNHRILTTNTFLAKINVTDNPLCNLCKEERESLEHLLWYCNKTQLLLNDFKREMETNNIQININPFSFLLCPDINVKENINSFYLLNVKYYIYISRCYEKTLHINGLINYLKKVFKVCYSSASYNNENHKFVQRWGNWQNFLA